jgi:tripartite-type tricarboxylate transporter receptor subunit TctC
VTNACSPGRSAKKFAEMVISAISGIAFVAFFAASSAIAQPYPRKPITLIVPFPPGAATDVFGRVAARRMSELLGQPIVVINRDGASGTIGTDVVAKAAPDGHTLLWGSSGPLAIAPVWTGKLPYEPLRDFQPISLFAQIPFLLVVHPSVPARSVKELVALALAKPGVLNFASSGTGGTAHLAAEMFLSMAGIRMTHIPYKGTALFASELLAGQVDLAFTGPTTSLPHLKTQRLRALATTATARIQLLPDLPPMSESGVPGYEFTQWYGLLAPSKTPAEMVSLLNSTLRSAMEDSDVQQRILQEGGRATPTTPEAFAERIKADLAKNSALIGRLKLKLE